MDTIWIYLKTNWKTNLLAFCAFAYSVPQFVTALQAWQAGNPVNWHGAVISLILAAVSLAAMDGSNVPTASQVQKATIEKPEVEAAVTAQLAASPMSNPNKKAIDVQSVPKA